MKNKNVVISLNQYKIDDIKYLISALLFLGFAVTIFIYITKKTISLEDSVPTSFLQSQTSILFVVDNFRDIINNYRIFEFRASFMPHDLMIDLHGNVIHPLTYRKEN